MTKVTIIGAGLTGLIAGVMLRSRLGAIFERAPALPHNHNALLRFARTDVEDATAIRFRRVRVLKSVMTVGNPVADAAAYSLKVIGVATLRSVAELTGGPRIEDRWIAPPDFPEALERNLMGPINYEAEAREVLRSLKGPIISTIPMPSLMDILDYPPDRRPRFNVRPGWVIRARLPAGTVDLHATIYIPNPGFRAYRASVTGNLLIVEGMGVLPTQEEAPAIARACIGAMGLSEAIGVKVPDLSIHSVPMAKISETDEDARRRFIVWATNAHGIYSLGRYAVWRPRVLLDDIVGDVHRILAMIDGDTAQQYREGLPK